MGEYRLMARDFIAVNRGVALMPVDMMDWLPKDHFVFMLLDVLQSADMSGFEAQYRLGGAGRQAYDPNMLVALLVYAYSQGVVSSRQIEQKCHTDVAFRVICGNSPPDHCAVARFRQRCSRQFASLFEHVLGVCASMGMMKVGVVSIDGTKIGARASSQANFTPDTVRRIAEEVVAEAERVDAAEDAEFGDRCGDELPDEWKAGPGRVAKIRALADKRRRAEQALEHATPAPVKTSKQDAKALAVADRKLNIARGALEHKISLAENDRQSSDTGRKPRKPVKELARVVRAEQRVVETETRLASVKAEVEAKQNRGTPKRKVVNLSDPDSSLMPLRGGGWVQGYNPQLAVSDDHLVIAADVTTSSSDMGSFVPMMGLAVAAVDKHTPGTQIGVILADAGYCSETALLADGPDRLIAVGRDPARNKAPRSNPAILAMGERLKPGTPERETYKRRAATVETVIGNVKETMGFKRFTRRGLQAVRDEWMLVTAVFNLRRLAAYQGIALA